MFYCLNVFSNDIYYLEKEDVIVIYQRGDNHIDLFDVVSLNEIHMGDILRAVADANTEKITFHFTPDDDQDLDLKRSINNDGLFVRTSGDHLYPMHVKHPITSIA